MTIGTIRVIHIQETGIHRIVNPGFFLTQRPFRYKIKMTP